MKTYVTSVKVEFSNGYEFEVQQDSIPENNGTSFFGSAIPPNAREFENLILDALYNLNLYPEATWHRNTTRGVPDDAPLEMIL